MVTSKAGLPKIFPMEAIYFALVNLKRWCVAQQSRWFTLSAINIAPIYSPPAKYVNGNYERLSSIL